MITAHIASLPERVITLEKTVNSLVNQVDEVYISLNNYTEIPQFLCQLDNVFASLTDNILGDAAKFIHVSSVKGYVFVCDDDLIYPTDYVEYMKSKVDEYKCVVSLLGKRYSQRPIKSFRRGYTGLYRCLEEVDGDYKVDLVGTGAMAYHTDHINVDVSEFTMRNMADIWMARLAKRQGVELRVVKHSADYVKHETYTYRIWTHTRDDIAQTSILNTFLT